MNATTPVVAALVDVVDALDAARVPYAITGSFAFSCYAYPRATRDVDLKVQAVRDDILARVEADLVKAGFVPLDATSFERRGFGVELYPAKTDLDRDALRRRVRARLFSEVDREFWVVTPEDLVLSKLREHLKHPASTKHVDDVKVLLTARGDLDMEFLRDALQRHGLVEAWRTWIGAV